MAKHDKSGVRVSDLKDQSNTPFPRPMLYCGACGCECSAHAGDYFPTEANFLFECCGEPMKLVVKHTTHEQINP